MLAPWDCQNSLHTDGGGDDLALTWRSWMASRLMIGRRNHSLSRRLPMGETHWLKIPNALKPSFDWPMPMAEGWRSSCVHNILWACPLPPFPAQGEIRTQDPGVGTPELCLHQGEILDKHRPNEADSGRHLKYLQGLHGGRVNTQMPQQVELREALHPEVQIWILAPPVQSCLVTHFLPARGHQPLSHVTSERLQLSFERSAQGDSTLYRAGEVGKKGGTSL